MTGGRLYNLKDLLSEEEEFMLTYGDGVSNVNLNELISFHKAKGKIATLTSVRPSARFGNIKLDESGNVLSFEEKPQTEQGWINGGFFIFKKEIFDFLRSKDEILEKYPLETLAERGELSAYQHFGFWQCMDTLRDMKFLNNLWNNNKADWKLW